MSCRDAAIRMALCIVLLAACAAPGPSEAENGGPPMVLDGTELVFAADIPETGLPAGVTGTYRSEQGGAEAVLRIESTSDGFRVIRSLSEPGSEPFVQVYTAKLMGEALISAEGTLTVRGAPEGVLVHEAAAQDQIVAPDYWVRYYRSQ